MPRNGAGTYSLPSGNPVVTNTTISSTWANNTLSDIATALTQSLTKDGQTVPSANLPMGSFKLTGLAAGTTAGDSVRFEQLFSQGNPTDVASASTTDIGAITSNFINITGTTTITSLGTAYNGPKMIKFTGALTLTYNATTLVTPTGKSILTKAGDTCIAIPKSTASGTSDGWNIIAYQSYAVNPIAGAGTDIASASTVDLTAAVGNVVVITGTTAVTAFTMNVGQTMLLVAESALPLTYNATTMNIQSGSSYTCTAGDRILVFKDIDNVIRVNVFNSSSGTSKIQPITASVGSNALTLTLNPTSLDFRSATLGSGTVSTLTVGAAISVVVSSGSTLGTTNGVQNRLAVIAINNAGTVELAVANTSATVGLDERGLISTTAEGGAGGADSANVIYSTTARSNVPYRIVGYVDSTQATAGTWATAPSLIQGVGGLITVPSQPSQVRLNTSNGYGSTNTRIIRYTNAVTNVGSDITYADSSTLGASITINTNGRYAISAGFNNAGSGGQFGLSLNTTQPTTNIASITVSDILAVATCGSANSLTLAVSWTGYLKVGDVIRPHADANATASAPTGFFNIIKLSD